MENVARVRSVVSFVLNQFLLPEIFFVVLYTETTIKGSSFGFTFLHFIISTRSNNPKFTSINFGATLVEGFSGRGGGAV